MKKVLSNTRGRGRDDEKGFSIVEVIVSITIASFVLAGFTSAVVLSLKGYRVGQEYSIAAQIAQEGMEMAISKRDNHTACVDDGSCPISNWQDNFADGGPYEIDATDPDDLAPNKTFSAFDSDHHLCITSDGKYGYSCPSGQALESNYTRKVEVMFMSTESVLVRTTVEWQSGNGSKQIVYEEPLYE